MDDQLRTRLAQARRRVETAVPYSPEWAAAIDALEELESEAAVDAREQQLPQQLPQRLPRLRVVRPGVEEVAG